MEKDVHQRISPYDRRRTGNNLKVVACSCQKRFSLEIQSYLYEKVSYSALELPFQNNEGSIRKHLKNTFKDVLCTTILVCHHVIDDVLNVLRDLEQETRSHIVIAGSSVVLVQLHDIQTVTIESKNYCHDVFGKISHILHEQCMYDDVALKNNETMATYSPTFEVDQYDTESTTYEKIPYENTLNDLNKNSSSSDLFLSNYDGNETNPTYKNISPRSKQTFPLVRQEPFPDETELKVVAESPQDNTNGTQCNSRRESRKKEENPYQYLSMNKREKLINLKTWFSGTENLFGVMVLEEFCSPFRSYEKTEKELVENINSGDKATVVESVKHVHSISIPSAVDQIDLPALSTLSDCYNNGIERRTAREIQNILFHTEVGRHKLEALLESVEVLLGVVRRRAASPDTMKNILPNVIVMLALVHHLLLSLSNKSAVSDIVSSRLKQCIALLEEIEYPQTEETELNLLNAVKIMISGLEKTLNGKKANRLQIGSWKDELEKHSCRTKLEKSLTKMTTFEHYSLIVRLIIELHQRLVEKHIDFLHSSLKSIKSTMKKTDGPILYPLLIVVFRGLTSILNNHIQQDHHRDETQDGINRTCMDILKISLRSSKVSLECKKDLRENLNSLLFHKSESVTAAVSALMETEGRFFLADKVYSYLKTALEPLSFSIHTEPQERQSLPRWEDISGTITGHKEVSLYVLLPGNGTVSLHKYHQSAVKDEKTGMHYNTLEILRSLLGNEHHPNMKRLIAFELQTIPMFYMTEKLSDATISTYLLRERKYRKWLSLRALGAMALDCVKAIHFLHERKIIHRNITATSFRYRGDHSTFVLSDFSIAKLIDDGSNGSGTFIQDIEGKLIPTRWSAPESLIDDRYDVMSDTWMLGHLLNEIFTHGCHPFPEMYTFPFDDLMDLVVFHYLKPRRYPCIPLSVHNIILQCVESNPKSRIKPKEILEKMELWMTSLCKQEEPHENQSVKAFTNKSLNYPDLDPNQSKPERGSTQQLKQLKSMRGNPRVSYYNSASKRRLSSFANKSCIKEQSLTAPDHPIVKEKGLYLEVEEPVTYQFLRDTFPRLSSKTALGELLHIVTFPPEHHQRDCPNPEGLTHALSYRCKKGDALFKIAETCMLGDPEDNEMPYLEVVYEIVQFVNVMHKDGWILRDLCCSTLYRSQVDDKVFMPRLGRMLKIEKRDSRIEAFIIDKSTCVDDRRNWMPVEVIQSGQFSQASDIYMMAMTILQFYSIASLFKSKPMSKRLEAIPFCKVEPGKLLETLYRGEIPEEPDSCPSWLFKLLKECWNRDSTQRPSAEYLSSEIFKRLVYSDDSTFDSVSSEQTSAGSMLSKDVRVHRTLPDIPPMESRAHKLSMKETDRPVPPPRPKHTKRKLITRQENEYYNVSKTGRTNHSTLANETAVHSKIITSAKQTVHANHMTAVSSVCTKNDISTTHSSNADDSNLSCANSSDGSFINARVKLQDKTLPQDVVGDTSTYLDLKPNEEACVKPIVVNSHPAEEANNSFQEKVHQTAFSGDCEFYQDFDPQIKGSALYLDVKPNEEACVKPIVVNSHPAEEGNNSFQEKVHRTAFSALPVGNVYDYATTFPKTVDTCSQLRPRQPLPTECGGSDISKDMSSTVTRSSSVQSSFSCANSEAFEYDYIEASPLNGNSKLDNICPSASKPCSGESSISDGALSCANSSIDNEYMGSKWNDKIGSVAREHIRNIYENTSPVSRLGPDSFCTVDDDGYEKPVLPSRMFDGDTQLYKNI